MKQTLLFLFIAFTITCQAQLNIKAGVNYTSYARGGGGGYEFGPFFGLNLSGKVLQTDLIWSREGAKHGAGWAIPVTHNFYVDYIKLSQTLQWRPCFGLSLNAGGYVSRIMGARTYRWNYGTEWKWKNNFMAPYEAGLQFGIKKHLPGPVVLEAGYSRGLTDVGLNGMDMDRLRSSRFFGGLVFLLNDKW